MSVANTCCSDCDDVAVNTPGSAGVNAYTTTTADFTIPAIGATVNISVGTNVWMGVGQKIFVSDGTYVGTFEVQSFTGSTGVTAEFMGYTDDSSPTDVIASGAKVSPSGVQRLLSGITTFTDNSGGTASDTIAVGVGKYFITVPLTSLATGLSTSAIDILTNLVVGHAFKLLSFDWVTTIVGAGAGASQTFNLEINTTNVTGGSLNPTLASTASIGGVTAGSAITANNTGSASDTISIEMAAGGTVFSSGAGYFVIHIQNMDTANAFASVAEKVDDILNGLQ